MDGKTKDTINARCDIRKDSFNVLKHLQFKKKEGEVDYEWPEAPYALSRELARAFCQFLRELRFPDGYASNFAKCVSHDGSKVQGLKTHDCHILLQTILAAGLRGQVSKDIYEAIAQLDRFFRVLCSKTINKTVLKDLEVQIPEILCRLECIFPPAFFDVMVHLAVHLPEEARQRGHVHYG
jgi:hypothetical protein